VEQVHAADEEAGDADEKHVVTVHHAASVPSDGEDGEGDDDAEDLNRTVEKQVVSAAQQVQRGYADRSSQSHETVPDFAVKLHPHMSFPFR
jgi:hypothetical protein